MLQDAKDKARMKAKEKEDEEDAANKKRAQAIFDEYR
jgi:hypothetical protein